MKILHIADVHIGAKNYKLSSEKQRLLRDNQLLQIKALFKMAYEEDYDAVIIAGDLFHSKSVPESLIKNFFTAVSDYSRPVIYVKGNHDEKVDFNDIPSNFIFLDDSRPYYKYMNISFWSGKSDFIARNIDSSSRNVLVLHGDITNQNSGDYIDILPYITKAKFDYVALGHVHSSQIKEMGGTLVAYPGSLFSNGYDETGDKGFLQVDMDDHKTTAKFVPFAKNRYMICQCDITGLDSFEDILNKAKESLSECRTTDIVKLQLIGYYNDKAEKYLGQLEEQLAVFVDFMIEDQSKLQLDFDALKNEALSFKAEFLTLVAQKEEDEAIKNKICQIGIEALRGDSLSI